MAGEHGIAWVISVDMGYGHQRAAYPLKDIAYERIITANSDKIISYDEKKFWDQSRAFYEFISRLKQLPLIGTHIFALYDKTQSIPQFFPFRDLTRPDIQTQLLKRTIKKGLCKSLIEYIKKKDLPIVTTHFIPALAAYYLGMKNIFCIVTDTDIARGWVIDNPKLNTITYLVPSVHTAVRLREYGITEDKIILTGFPLPKENIGGRDFSILKDDLGNRLPNLDPNNIFIKKYREVLKKRLEHNLKTKSDHPLTLAYLVGGAGAAPDIGLKVIKSVADKIIKGRLILNISVGTRLDVFSYYNKSIESMGMKEHLGKSINLIFALDKRSYFEALNQALRKTDIIWTKPSEMSFYTALGLPVIIAPPIGAHEVYNQQWLNHMGSGFVQEDPEFTADWLYFWLEEGKLAEAAWRGWIDAPALGTYEIERIIREVIRKKTN